AQAAHAIWHAVSSSLTVPRLLPVRRLSTAAVAAQRSAQSRSVRMQSRSSATDSSARQASAHAAHVVAQAEAASMASASNSTSRPAGGLGWDVIIAVVLMGPSGSRVRVRVLLTLGTRPDLRHRCARVVVGTTTRADGVG